MKKKTVKKRFPTIPILLLLFLGSLCYAIYDAYGPFSIKIDETETKENIPEYFDYGAITDSIYCNDFFGFRIPIPANHKGNYKKYDYIEKTLYERDSTLAVATLTSEIIDHDLFRVEPEFIKIDLVKMFLEETKTMDDMSEYMGKKSQRERFGAEYQMIIRVHRLFGATLKSYTNQFENLHNPDYANPSTKLISGIRFQELHGRERNGESVPGQVMFRMLGGKNKNIISFNTEIHDFAFSIDLFYQTDEQKCILLEMVDTITFH